MSRIGLHLPGANAATIGFLSGVMLLVAAQIALALGAWAVADCILALLIVPLHLVLLLVLWVGSLVSWNVEHIALWAALVMPYVSPIAWAVMGWGIGKLCLRIRSAGSHS